VRRNLVIGLAIVLGLIAVGCSRADDTATSTTAGSSGGAIAGGNSCEGVTLQATDTGVAADTITVQVMADTGSPLAPGLFQGNVDAMLAFEKFVNANGGIGCRQLKVETWDSKLDPSESKNGQINACSTALALVGGNSLFNPDVTAMDTCVDSKGQATGLANVSALSNDVNEQCSLHTYTIQLTAEPCQPDGTPITGQRELTSFVGQVDWFQKTIDPNLTGLYLVPGDLPTTIASATPQIVAQQQIGVNWLGPVKVSTRDEQSAYTPKIQSLRNGNANYVFDGSNDTVMINIRREAAAQGLDTVKIWSCSLSCYTDKFKAAGNAVDGTYTWMQFLPFEDKGANQELDNYLEAIETPDSFGAQAWMAGVLFQQAVDKIVASDGPNAITRASLIAALNSIDSFDANGWMGPKDPKGGVNGTSNCMVILTSKDGEFQRTYPTEKGTFDCNPAYLRTVNIDPAIESAKVQ